MIDGQRRGAAESARVDLAVAAAAEEVDGVAAAVANAAGVQLVGRAALSGAVEQRANLAAARGRSHHACGNDARFRGLPDDEKSSITSVR